MEDGTGVVIFAAGFVIFVAVGVGFRRYKGLANGLNLKLLTWLTNWLVVSTPI